jgi:amino acid permease
LRAAFVTGINSGASLYVLKENKSNVFWHLYNVGKLLQITWSSVIENGHLHIAAMRTKSHLTDFKYISQLQHFLNFHGLILTKPRILEKQFVWIASGQKWSRIMFSNRL